MAISSNYYMRKVQHMHNTQKKRLPSAMFPLTTRERIGVYNSAYAGGNGKRKLMLSLIVL